MLNDRATLVGSNSLYTVFIPYILCFPYVFHMYLMYNFSCFLLSLLNGSFLCLAEAETRAELPGRLSIWSGKQSQKLIYLTVLLRSGGVTSLDPLCTSFISQALYAVLERNVLYWHQERVGKET